MLKTDRPSGDLIGGKIEVAFDPIQLTALGIQSANTYVGKLSSDGTYWSVDSTLTNIHNSENKTRLLGVRDPDH